MTRQVTPAEVSQLIRKVRTAAEKALVDTRYELVPMYLKAANDLEAWLNTGLEGEPPLNLEEVQEWLDSSRTPATTVTMNNATSVTSTTHNLKEVAHEEYDVFLSYSSQDRDWVRYLAESLMAAGIRVFFDEFEILPGESIPNRIEQALLGSRKIAIILSPAYVVSKWALLERLPMIYNDPDISQRRIIPLLRQECERPLLVRHLHYIDFRDDSHFEEQLGKLLQALRQIDSPQQTLPAPEINRARAKMLLRSRNISDMEKGLAILHRLGTSEIDPELELLRKQAEELRAELLSAMSAIETHRATENYREAIQLLEKLVHHEIREYRRNDGTVVPIEDELTRIHNDYRAFCKRKAQERLQQARNFLPAFPRVAQERLKDALATLELIPLEERAMLKEEAEKLRVFVEQFDRADQLVRQAVAATDKHEALRLLERAAIAYPDYPNIDKMISAANRLLKKNLME